MTEHDRFRDDLPLLLTGDLEPVEAAALEAHLSACPECQEERALLAGTIAGLRRAGERSDDEVDLRGFYDERVGGHVGRMPRWPALALRAAALALVFVGGVAAGRASRTPPPPAPSVARAERDAVPVKPVAPTPTKSAAPRPTRQERAYRAAVGGESGLARGLVALAELSRE